MLSAPMLVAKSWIGWKKPAESPGHRPYWLISLINRLFDNMEYFLMPNKYQNGNSLKTMPEYSFATVRLDVKQKAHFEGWLADNSPAFEELIASLVLTGHKTSFSWDESNDCFIASMTCNDKKSTNFQKVMTSRAQDWFEALMMTVYKIMVVCENEAWPTDRSTNNWG